MARFQSHRSRRAIVAGLIAMTLIGAALVILPEIVRHVAVKRLQSILTVEASIEDVDFNPFTGHASIKRLVIGSEAAPILRVPSISLEFFHRALVTGRIGLQSLVIHEPRLTVERLKDGQYNLTRALDLPARHDSGGGIDFTVERMELHGGEVKFIDRTQPADPELTFASLDVVAGPISSLPDTRAAPTEINGGVQIAGGTIKISGTSRPMGKPLELDLNAEVDGVELEKLGVYLPYGGRLDLRRTTIKGNARYVLAHLNGEVAQHGVDGEVQLGGIVLASTHDGRKTMRLEGAAARNVRIDFLQNRGEVGALSLGRPYFLVRRDARGFNFEQYLPGGSPAFAKTPQDKEGRQVKSSNNGQMAWMLKQAEAKAGTVEFIDETVSPAVYTSLQSVNIAAENMTILPHLESDKINVEARSGNGSIRVNGAIQGAPLQGEFSVIGDGVPFKPFSGYLNELFRAARSSGESLKGEVKIAFAPEKSGAIATWISGRLVGNRMALRFVEAEEAFLTTPRLGVGVKMIHLGAEPRVDIESIDFGAARLDFVRGPEGQVNLRRLWSSDGSEGQSRRGEKPSQNKSSDESAMTVAIRSITFKNGVLDVLDRSVSPNYTTQVSKLNGTIRDFLPATQRAQIQVDGVLGDDAKLQLSGWATPFTDTPTMQLEGSIKSYDLRPLNPYATEYVSHSIRQGEIATDISFKMDEKNMRAQTEVVLRNVRIGEKTGDEFANRVGIPLELALALLQDVRGVVRLQFAITGDSGAKLNVGALIWEAVKNALVRALTAPFRLVGRIFTAGGRIGSIQIDPVRFEPGTRDLQAASADQLAQLADLLKEKPRLEISLKGQASRDEISAVKKRVLAQKTGPVDAPDYEKALVKIYRDMVRIRLNAPLAPRVEDSMEEVILERLEVTDEQLRELAHDRARLVEEELGKRGVDRERLRVIDGDVVADGAPQVEFTLIS